MQGRRERGGGGEGRERKEGGGGGEGREEEREEGRGENERREKWREERLGALKWTLLFMITGPWAIPFSGMRACGYKCLGSWWCGGYKCMCIRVQQ